MKKVIFLLALTFPFLFACQEKTQEKMTTRTQILMNTFVTITLPSKYHTEISKSFNKIKEIENALSSYDNEASVYRLNQTHSIAYNQHLQNAINLSRKYYKKTKGYFDITIGSISKKLYHFGEQNATIPSKTSLQAAHLDIKGIHMNEKYIRTDKNIVLDLGGMGKGYGVDKVVKMLSQQNITKGSIALSGDIRCLDACTVYIQSPLSESMFAQIHTQIPNVSISTSGTYRRYVKEKEAHHLINPKAKKPQKNFISVSLFSLGDNTRLDAYATAVSVMPLTTALNFLKQYEDISFILVKYDGDILYGDQSKLLHISWLPYKERASIHKSKESKKKKSSKEKTLTHPNISNPKKINR